MKSTLALSALVVFAAVAVVALPGPALAKEVAGVNVPDTITVEGKTLKLNGAGIRKKFIIKVYVGALYLETTATNANAIIKADEAKQIRMHFLRGVEKDKILGAYKEGFEKNSKSKVAELQVGLDKLSAGLADMNKGGEMTVTYVPGKGTIVKQSSGAMVEVAGKEFADALLRTWLGSEPADGDLKKEMLAGGASAAK